jgi:hypothetical protein
VAGAANVVGSCCEYASIAMKCVLQIVVPTANPDIAIHSKLKRRERRHRSNKFIEIQHPNTQINPAKARRGK